MNTSPRRSWLLVGGTAAVGTAATVVLTLVTGSNGSPTPVPSPSGLAVQSTGDAGDLVTSVRRYYAAIRAGDAAEALRHVAPVSDKRLLTDTALRAQAAIGRIEKVTVDPDVLIVKNRALVDVVMTVNGKDYDDLIRVPKVNGRWLLPGAAELSAEPTAYGLLGQTIPAKTKAFVFPGALRTTGKSPYVTVTGDTDVVPGTGPASPFLDRKYSLNAAGATAIRAAVRRGMAACATQRTLSPSDCPNSTISVAGTEVPGSARWTAPTDYAPVTFDDDVDFGVDAVSVTGTVQFRVTYQVKNGRATRTVRETVAAPLNGTVDLTTTPPTYTD